jgi:hypothetical protein
VLLVRARVLLALLTLVLPELLVVLRVRALQVLPVQVRVKKVSAAARAVSLQAA